MCAPAPPSWHAHLTDPAFRTPPPPGQGLPLNEILQGPADLSLYLVYKVPLQERCLMAAKNYCRAPLEHKDRVKYLTAMSLWPCSLKLAVMTPKSLTQEPDAAVSPHVCAGYDPKDPSCLFIAFPKQQP